MKNIIITLLALSLFAWNTAIGQYNISEGTEYVDGTMVSTLMIQVDASKKDTKAAWNNYWQDNIGVDIKGYGWLKKSDRLTTEMTLLNGYSSETISIDAAFSGDENQTNIVIHLLDANDEHKMDVENRTQSHVRELSERFVATFLPNYYGKLTVESQENYHEVNDDITDINEEISDKKSEVAELQKQIRELNMQLNSKDIELTEARAQLKATKAQYEEVDKEIDKLIDSREF